MTTATDKAKQCNAMQATPTEKDQWVTQSFKRGTGVFLVELHRLASGFSTFGMQTQKVAARFFLLETITQKEVLAK